MAAAIVCAAITSHLVSAEIAGYLPYGEDWKPIVLPGALSSKPEYKKLGKYAYGEIKLEEGTRLNAVVRVISRKNRAELGGKLPLNCHAAVFEREGGYKTVIFDMDED